MNEWIFSKTKICKSRFKSWIRLSESNLIILSDYAKKKKKKKKSLKGQQVLIYQTFEKIDLANSKSDVDQLHTDKLKKCTKCFKDFKK